MSMNEPRKHGESAAATTMHAHLNLATEVLAQRLDMAAVLMDAWEPWVSFMAASQ